MITPRCSWNQVTEKMRKLYRHLVQARGSSLLGAQPMIEPRVASPPPADKAEVGERWKFAQQMEREFWLNLDEAEFQAQQVGYKNTAGDLVRHARAHFGPPDDIRVLQVGCAVEDSVMYFPYGKRFAIDPLAEFYLQHFERSRNRAVTYFTAVGEAIPFAQDVFDLVICTNVLDHVVNPQSLLHEVKRTLKSGGSFFLSVDVYPRETYLQRVAREATGEVVDPCHPHTFTNEILRKLVSEIGFRVLTGDESASGKGDDSVRFELTLINEKRAGKR